MMEKSSPRRAPEPDARRRNAERTRERIVEAALAEFAAKGYAGARVRGIAERAGVNAQLISYYFGGKEGLYREILDRWHAREAGIEGRELPLPEFVAAYVDATLDSPDLLRMFVWEGLTAGGPAVEQPTVDGEAPEVVALRERQAAGELAGDIDPAYLLVAVMGATAAPAVMPQHIERLCGVAADSDEFRTRFAEQLRVIVGHLRAGGGA